MDVTTVVLSGVIEVDSIDENVGKLLSDLGSLVSRVTRVDGDEVPLGDAVFMAGYRELMLEPARKEARDA